MQCHVTPYCLCESGCLSVSRQARDLVQTRRSASKHDGPASRGARGAALASAFTAGTRFCAAS